VTTAGPRAEATQSRDGGTVGRPPARRLGIVAVIALMYLVVSGGAYGLEDAVQFAGARLTLLLCLIVPLTLSLPTALMAAELTALMPLEGGFYYWVREALGPFAAFVEAYLTLLYTATDMAIYPVLIAAYLGFVFPLGTAAQIALGIVLIWLSGALNILGVRPVGNASIVLMGAVLAPFAAMVLIGFPRLLDWHLPAQSLHGGGFLAALGGGLTVVIWNFSGWENLSVVAGEIENPQRTYVRAIVFALPLVALGYLLPLAVSLSGATSTANWRVGYFVEIGRSIGGPMLAIALAVGGATSAFSIFDAAMLWVSRMPYVLAREGYLPPHLARVWAAHATPATTIVPDSDAPIATSSAPPAITQSAASATAPTPRSAEPLVDAEPFGGDGPLDDTNLLGGSPATSIVASSAASATAPTPRGDEPPNIGLGQGNDRSPAIPGPGGNSQAEFGDPSVLGGSPATSIIACCAVFTILVPLGFSSLVVLDVFFYMGALTLEMWALIRLRKSHPDRAGLFVIGGGRVALIAVVVAPIITWMATFGLAISNHGGAAANDGGAAALIISIVLALGAWPAYAFLRHRYGGPQIAP
jgi:amino acid transporter